MIDPEIKRGSSEEMQWVEQEGSLAHHVAKGGLRIFVLRGVVNEAVRILVFGSK
jgi:hypothetical protein